MDIWIVKNKNEGKKILGSDWFEGGPFFQKKYAVWFRKPFDSDNGLVANPDMTVDENTIEELFSFSKETKVLMAQIQDNVGPTKFKVQVLG